jgi:hypothetical protein
MSSFATTFKLHTEKASTSSSPSICIILFKIWVSNFKTYNAMQFLDRQGIINLSQEFSEKNLHAISYSFQRSDWYMSLNRMMKKLFWQYCTYPGIYEMQTAFNLPLIAKNQIIMKQKYKQYCRN